MYLDPAAMAAGGGVLCFATNLEHAGDVVDQACSGSSPSKSSAVLCSPGRGGIVTSYRGPPSIEPALGRRLAGNRRRPCHPPYGRGKGGVPGAGGRGHRGTFEHLREGRVGSVEISALNLDALRDLKRVNAYLVAAAAYPVLESKGELLPSRLR
jgi:phosphate:Na+ symporter